MIPILLLIHRMPDKVRGQRVGSWTWTALMVVGCSFYIGGFAQASAAKCQAVSTQQVVLPVALGALALTNASHGLASGHKFSLIGFVLVVCSVEIAVCGNSPAIQAVKSGIGVTVLSSVCFHMAELYLRHFYARNVQENQRLAHVDDERKRLEERNEQLQAEKERLLYDVQRRGCPLDDDYERSAIRRGLHAGGRHRPSHTASEAGASEAGGGEFRESSGFRFPVVPSSSDSAGGTIEQLELAEAATAAEAEHQLVILKDSAG